MTAVPTTLGKQASFLRCSMNTDRPPLRSGQWLPCLSEKEKWVLVVADLGKAPNRLGKGQATGGREAGANVWGLEVGRRVLGARPRERAEALSREKVEEPKELLGK